MDHDLNTKLANYCVTCQARADQSRAAAAEARARPKTGWDEYDRQTDAEASGHDAEAARWGQRETHARGGKMLVDDDDLHHQHEHQALIDDAASQYRTVHVPGA